MSDPCKADLSNLCANDVKQFTDGPVYKEFCRLAEIRKAQILSELSSLPSTPTLEHLRYLQGELHEVTFWREFPAMVLAELNDKQENV